MNENLKQAIELAKTLSLTDIQTLFDAVWELRYRAQNKASKLALDIINNK